MLKVIQTIIKQQIDAKKEKKTGLVKQIVKLHLILFNFKG